MANHFSQEQLRVRPSSKGEAVVASACAHFEGTLVRVRGEPVGSVAALEHPKRSDAATYGEVFLRANEPVMLYLLVQGRLPHQLRGAEQRTDRRLRPALHRPDQFGGRQLLLDLVLHPSFEGTPVLFVPDCAS